MHSWLMTPLGVGTVHAASTAHAAQLSRVCIMDTHLGLHHPLAGNTINSPASASDGKTGNPAVVAAAVGGTVGGVALIAVVGLIVWRMSAKRQRDRALVSVSDVSRF
jgi:hypothetical protein